MIDNYEADIVLTDDELTKVGAEIPIIQHGLVIDNIIENAKNWNNQVRIFIRDERELQNYYQGLRTQNYLVNDAVEYFTQYYFDLKNGNKKNMLVRSVEYTPLSHPHIHHQNTYEVIQVDLYDLKSRQTKTIFKRPDSTDPNTPMIYYPKQKTLEFKFQQPKDTSNGVRYDDYSISRSVPRSYYTRDGSIPIQGPKAPKAPQGPKTPQPTMVIPVERTQKRVGPLMPADYEKEK